MSKSALLVGINYYGTSNKLNGCINDVINMQRVLVRHLGFDHRAITVLHDGGSRTSAVSKPSRRNILSHLKALVKSPSTFKFFHYSGHGSQRRDSNGDELDGMDECLCPSSGGWIVDDEIKRILDGLPKNKHMFMIFDCCHSGTVADLYKEWYVRRGKIRRIVNARTKQITGSIVTLSGCRDDQTSADAWEERQSQGALTYAFRKALKQDPKDYRTLLLAVVKILVDRRYSQRAVLCMGRKNMALSDRVMWEAFRAEALDDDIESPISPKPIKILLDKLNCTK